MPLALLKQDRTLVFASKAVWFDSLYVLQSLFESHRGCHADPVCDPVDHNLASMACKSTTINCRITVHTACIACPTIPALDEVGMAVQAGLDLSHAFTQGGEDNDLLAAAFSLCKSLGFGV